jgi:hypothetical protein
LPRILYVQSCFTKASRTELQFELINQEIVG